MHIHKLMATQNVLTRLKSISGLSLRSILIFCFFGSTVFITILMVFLIKSVGGNFLEVLITFLVTPIAWIALLARRFIGLDQTNGSQGAILEFLEKQPDPAKYELRLIPIPSGKFRRELPLDGFWEGLLRPRVVQGWYIYIKGLHTRACLIDITQRTIEYTTPKDGLIDIPEERGGGSIAIKKAIIPYWVTNPVKAFYNVLASESDKDPNKAGEPVNGYIFELENYIRISIAKAVSLSDLELDELLTRAHALGPDITKILREKLEENDIGVGIGTVDSPDATPSDKYLDDRELTASRRKEEEARLVEYEALQKRIFLLMGLDEHGQRDPNRVPDNATMTLDQILQDRYVMQIAEKAGPISINSLGGNFNDIVKGIMTNIPPQT